MTDRTRQWVYARPIRNGTITADLFELREVPIPRLNDSEALVRVKLVNIHANTRTRLATGLVPLGETDPANYACAEVIESRTPIFKRGQLDSLPGGLAGIPDRQNRGWRGGPRPGE